MGASRAIVERALTLLGVPYIWAAKGDFVVRDNKVLPITAASCLVGVDCSGLVTLALLKANGHDLRGMWGADAMWKHLPLPAPGESFCLALYGTPERAIHVAFDLGNGLVLEAAGGDQRTLTAEDAAHVGAKVRVGCELRRDRIGTRSLEALITAPIFPPQS